MGDEESCLILLRSGEACGLTRGKSEWTEELVKTTALTV